MSTLNVSWLPISYNRSDRCGEAAMRLGQSYG